MGKKDAQPKYHDETADKADDLQTGWDTGKNEYHNLFTAGNVIGQRINTSTYNSRYTRKKGMRFFTIAVAVLFLSAVIFLIVNPHEDITLLYSTESGIIMHRVDVNLFGKYLLKEESEFKYNYEDLEYGRLKGKSAQFAVMAKAHDADIIIADSMTLLEMGIEKQLIDHSRYTGSTRSDMLLRHDLFENDLDLLYGLKASEVDFAVAADADTISIVAFGRGSEWKVIKRFVECLYEELDYTEKRIG